MGTTCGPRGNLTRLNAVHNLNKAGNFKAPNSILNSESNTRYTYTYMRCLYLVFSSPRLSPLGILRLIHMYMYQTLSGPAPPSTFNLFLGPSRRTAAEAKGTLGLFEIPVTVPQYRRGRARAFYSMAVPEILGKFCVI